MAYTQCSYLTLQPQLLLKLNGASTSTSKNNLSSEQFLRSGINRNNKDNKEKGKNKGSKRQCHKDKDTKDNFQREKKKNAWDLPEDVDSNNAFGDHKKGNSNRQIFKSIKVHHHKPEKWDKDARLCLHFAVDSFCKSGYKCFRAHQDQAMMNYRGVLQEKLNEGFRKSFLK